MVIFFLLELDFFDEDFIFLGGGMIFFLGFDFLDMGVVMVFFKVFFFVRDKVVRLEIFCLNKYVGYR